MPITPRPITIDDLPKLGLVHDPQSSGNHIAWVVTKMDTEEDTYTSAIWLADVDGSNAHQLTNGKHRDANPRFSPDGTMIAFTSNRPPVLQLPKEEQQNDDDTTGHQKKTEKKATAPKKHPNQIWVIRLDGGEAQQVSNLKYGAGPASWNSDGTFLTFSAASDPEKGEGATFIGEIADERVVKDLRYRFDGRGWLNRWSHIWKVELATGEHTQLTFGDVNDQDPQWQPGGDLIAFSSNRRDDRKRFLSPMQLFVVDANGGDVERIGGDDVAFHHHAWSRGGDKLAWVGIEDSASFTQNANLWTANADGSAVTNHTRKWDVSIGDSNMSDVHGASDSRPMWTDDDEVLFLASTRGETHLYVCNVARKSATPTAVTSGKQRVAGFARSDAGLVLAIGHANKPAELYLADTEGNNTTAITNVNEDILNELRLNDVTELDVTAPDGWKIQAWVLPPVNLEPGKKYPTIVQIHGGPHGMYGYDFFHEMQTMSAGGYGVVFSNPRGSQGYGYEFTSSTRANWGVGDMPDVIASLETAISTVDWIDTDRLGITGGSYGGYLTNWIIGHDDRFKAAVTQRCVSNFHSFFGTSDIGVNFGEFEFGGTPWKDSELLLKHSPISYVEDMHTPLLIIHSEQDLRCPIEQAEQLFVALKYLERETEFVRIPEESHDLSRSGTPSRRKARLSHIIGWFDTYL